MILGFMCGECGEVWSDPEDECACPGDGGDGADLVTTAHDDDGVTG